MQQELWSEILPGLWQGGTHHTDTRHSAQRSMRTPTKADFDTVITHYGDANGAGWGVKEIRFPFFDGDMTDFDPETDLRLPVEEAFKDWQSGKRVLIRCQAGWNRSGLVTALTLIKVGYQPKDAIKLIREKRCQEALCNPIFEDWLLSADCLRR